MTDDHAANAAFREVCLRFIERQERNKDGLGVLAGLTVLCGEKKQHVVFRKKEIDVPWMNAH